MVVDQADCLDYMDGLKGGYDVIIADPPYNIGKDFGNDSDKQPMGEYLDWSVTWMEKALNLLNSEGLLYVYGFSEILARLSARFPIERQRWLVWHYTNKVVPTLKFWQRTHESILCMWKDKRPDIAVNELREEYGRDYRRLLGRTRKGSPKARFGSKDTFFADKGGCLPRDVIYEQAMTAGRQVKQGRGHPTQKPLELSYRLLISACNYAPRNSSAFIPFAGSGSECVTAKNLGIQFHACEINPEYVKMANTWLEETKPQRALML